MLLAKPLNHQSYNWNLFSITLNGNENKYRMLQSKFNPFWSYLWKNFTDTPNDKRVMVCYITNQLVITIWYVSILQTKFLLHYIQHLMLNLSSTFHENVSRSAEVLAITFDFKFWVYVKFPMKMLSFFWKKNRPEPSKIFGFFDFILKK